MCAGGKFCGGAGGGSSRGELVFGLVLSYPGLLGLGSSIIKMAIAFQFPGICIDLGGGVG